MTRKTMALIALATIVLVGVFIAGAAASNSNNTATCHDGQTLAWIKVGNDTFKQGKPLPEGASITDSVSGQGLDYTVRSTKDSATLKVHGNGAATFEAACR